MNYDNNYNNGYPNNQYNDYNNYNNNYNNNTNYNTQPNGNLYDFSQDLKPNNYNNYNNMMNNNNNKKPKRKGGFLAFLEFLIIVFLCLYIANDKGYIHIKFLDNLIPVKEAKKEEPKEEPKKEPDIKKEEVKVTDESVMQTYINKTYYIGNIGVNYSNLISPVYSKNTKAEDLTEDEKLLSTLMSFITVTQEITVLKNEEEFKAVFPNEDISKMVGVRFIEADKISARYKETFGGELQHKNIDTTCPVVKYSETYKKYYLSSYCDSKPITTSIDQLVYKVTTLGDNYYAYLCIATYKENEDGTISYYKDVTSTETYKVFTKSEFQNFKITPDIINEFPKYRITYTKNGDDYVFSSIEKLEESDDA